MFTVLEEDTVPNLVLVFILSLKKREVQCIKCSTSNLKILVVDQLPQLIGHNLKLDCTHFSGLIHTCLKDYYPKIDHGIPLLHFSSPIYTVLSIIPNMILFYRTNASKSVLVRTMLW